MPIQLTINEKRAGMRHAVLSACWGVLAQILVKESSVVILFAMMIGAGEMFALFTTSILDVALCLTMLPFAYLAGKRGNRATTIHATCTGMAAILLCAAAPWFGRQAQSILFVGLAIYALSISAYTAGWFPLLNDIVPQSERGRFFGRLRTAWQTTAALFLILAGIFAGKTAGIGKLQLILAAGGLAMAGRIWHLSRVAEADNPHAARYGFKLMLMDIIGNRQLVAFGVYLFALYAAASAMVPTAFMMAKNHLLLPDNIVILLSAVVFAGTIAGYFVGGKFVDRIGVKPVFLSAHLGFAGVNFIMLAVNRAAPTAVPLMSAMLLLQGFLVAGASIAVSTEMLALSPPNNKPMSIAFCFSLYSAGIGFSRLMAALVLGSGMLAESWTLFGRGVSRYHTLFLCYGIAVLFAAAGLVLVPALTRGARRLPGVT